MTSRSSSTRVAALLAALIAAVLACAGPARAASHGIGGYITDADTGLPLAQASVVWNGTTTPPPNAVTDGSGRYAFYGLQAGETGSLSVAGPAGYDRVTVPGITVPADGIGAQHVPLHRDWASTGGGGHTSANDESGAGGGCGSAAATDADRSTAWSASASRPAGDPPTLTVALPQEIQLTTVVLDAGSGCGHDAGTALGKFRVETSADGSTWAAAADGELATADRGVPHAFTPTANTAGVRFVRLIALTAQDPAATTIDVRDFQAFGLRPNVAPTGTVTVEAPRNYVNGVVRLTASFTDPDSSISKYLWDFNGDGTWDQVTFAPTVAHVWGGAGIYHVTVGARDFQGALGTTVMDLRIIDPAQPVEPIPQRRPLITFDPPDGIDLMARIACASQCRFSAKMVLSQRTARKLHLKRRTIRTMHRSTEGPGLGTWTLELPQSVIKRLRKAHMTKVKVRVTATAVDQQKRRSTVSRWVTFR